MHYESDNPNGFVTGKKFRIDKPCVTVMGNGMGGDSLGHWHIVFDGKPEMKTDSNKPPYKVSSMDEIRAIRPNGYKVVSTFSGCGGSCTGYRMAGFQVLWANEFVPAAQESYKANAAPDCILDGRDIRKVTAAEILKATKLKKGELDLFDGSPPCQAFSTAGKREKGWGKDKVYEHGAKQKNEELFSEYIRLLDGLQPKTLVAENVSGLVKGVAKGFFLEILAALKACGYNVKTRLLDAQWLGVPQQRQRIIFVGVRNDLKLEPAFPKPLSYFYSVRDACPDIFRVRKGLGFGEDKWVGADTVGAGPASGNNINNGNGAVLARIVNNVHDTGGHNPVTQNNGNKPMDTIPASPADANHFTVRMLPPSLVKAGAYGVSEIQPSAPSPTVTIASPGNDLAVPYGAEKRKFTIAELKRICAFPDDFILTGSYAQQWERLGNSVPPVMMYYIADIIRREILDKASHAKQKPARKQI